MRAPIGRKNEESKEFNRFNEESRSNTSNTDFRATVK